MTLIINFGLLSFLLLPESKHECIAGTWINNDNNVPVQVGARRHVVSAGRKVGVQSGLVNPDNRYRISESRLSPSTSRSDMPGDPGRQSK